MSQIFDYKCPSCGGAVEFDGTIQKIKCPYCDTEFEIEQFSEGSGTGAKERPKEDYSDWCSYGSEKWSEGEEKDMQVFICESCGGEIIADSTTGATECPFCNNKLVLKEQFSDELKPDFVIPFKIDKKGAKSAYLNFLKGKPFLPKVFKSENHIDEMKGIYVPFWLYTADADGDASYKAQVVRSWESGDTRYTEYKKYRIERAGNMSFDNIPIDSSSKIDNVLTEAIEPFDFSEAVPFNTAYLAGYAADRYDVQREECNERIAQRIKQSAVDCFRDSISGTYTSVQCAHSDVRIKNANFKYVLYPVWLLNTTWQGKKYVFAMNGQTGKLIGDLPADKGAYWRFIAGATAVSSAVIFAVSLLLGFI